MSGRSNTQADADERAAVEAAAAASKLDEAPDGGRYIDAQGRLVNANGELLNKDGSVKKSD